MALPSPSYNEETIYSIKKVICERYKGGGPFYILRYRHTQK